MNTTKTTALGQRGGTEQHKHQSIEPQRRLNRINKGTEPQRRFKSINKGTEPQRRVE